jgi:hypothetical protein
MWLGKTCRFVLNRAIERVIVVKTVAQESSATDFYLSTAIWLINRTLHDIGQKKSCSPRRAAEVRVAPKTNAVRLPASDWTVRTLLYREDVDDMSPVLCS